MSEFKHKNGQTSEEYWTDKISKNLIGRKITKIMYMDKEEMEDNLWHKRPVSIELDGKYWLVPMMDDEGNDGGAIATTFNDLGTIPVI